MISLHVSLQSRDDLLWSFDHCLLIFSLLTKPAKTKTCKNKKAKFIENSVWWIIIFEFVFMIILLFIIFLWKSPSLFHSQFPREKTHFVILAVRTEPVTNWESKLASRIASKIKSRDWIVLILLHKRSGMTGKLYKNSLLSCCLKRIAWGSRKKTFFYSD